MANDTKAAKTKYVAETTINHDGRDYLVGDEIELTDEQAKPLLLSHDVSEPALASTEAKEAPKARKKEADDKEAAAARRDYDKAQRDAEDADADAKKAAEKAADAKKRADAAKARLAKMKGPKGDGPQTWEKDAEKLGAGTTPGLAAGTPAKAPAQGAAMTPSTPTQEAVDKA